MSLILQNGEMLKGGSFQEMEATVLDLDEVDHFLPFLLYPGYFG